MTLKCKLKVSILRLELVPVLLTTLLWFVLSRNDAACLLMVCVFAEHLTMTTALLCCRPSMTLSIWMYLMNILLISHR